MSFKIRTKLITAFIGLISVILGIAGGIAYYNQRVLHKAIQCSEEAEERMQLVSMFQLALDRVLMPGNDYIITGDRKYVSEFETASYGIENGIKMVEESMAHLRGSLKADEIKEEEIFRDVKLAWQNIKEISLKIFAITDPARDKTAAMLMEEMDYKWAYPAVKRLDRLNEMSRKAYREDIEAVYKTWRRSWFIMGVGAFFLFAAGVSFALL